MIDSLGGIWGHARKIAAQAPSPAPRPYLHHGVNRSPGFLGAAGDGTRASGRTNTHFYCRAYRTRTNAHTHTGTTDAHACTTDADIGTCPDRRTFFIDPDDRTSRAIDSDSRTDSNLNVDPNPNPDPCRLADLFR